MSKATALAAADNGLLVQQSFRNKLINGNFDFWQRNITQSVTGMKSDDRWHNEFSGTTCVHTREAFATNQTEVPNFPVYFSRTVVSSVTGAANYARKIQKIEDVSTLAGKNFTLTFWAKANAPKNLAIDFVHRVSTGLHTYGQVTKLALTTSWKKYTVKGSIIPVGSFTGQRGGLQVRFWFDAGTTSNAFTDTLGHQSGTFDLAQIQLEEGVVETPFEVRPWALELLLCQRYFEKTYDPETIPGTVTNFGVLTTRQCTGASTASSFDWRFAVTKYGSASPPVVTYNPAAAGSTARNHTTATNCTSSGESGPFPSKSGAFIAFTTAAGSAVGNLNTIHATVEAEVP